ncbi:MAG: cytochrome-c oxidase, cbb3-type subunit I [Crocinitomix sp.]|nr:cytochrome-c oxidase, cbb3-type subunit I [Crocinitomix sp.]
MQVEKFSYDNRIVKLFLIATITWGLIGMLVGLFASLELVWPELNATSWLSFGRIRPLHTNAVIFAFVGNGIFAGVYYSLQRLLKARMYSDLLSNINFWGWQLIIVAAVITLPMGYTSGKEYAELEWPIDIAITLMWLVWGINMFGTILKRRVKHMYVAIWFYIATFVTVAVLHLVNSVELPVSFMKSYSWYAGVQDALVQWWYGHNAVAFFLTTPYLGLMYYFVPKAANRPVYSYRLSIIHFWSLIFIYIWAGPHHLLYSSLPDWAQSLGIVFSIMLLFPSWGGMLNGLLTLRGVWDKVRDDAVLKFMVVAITCYGMATFEGPLLSLKNVNWIAHFTDWIVAHVHVGGLGWNGMLTFGMAYYLVPKLWRTNLYSKALANAHFWIATLGIVLWTIPMYFAGFMQSLMWKQFTPSGDVLQYDFIETVAFLRPYFMLRSLGGLLFITGVCIMVYNLWKTARMGDFLANEEAEAPALVNPRKGNKGEHWHSWIERRPMKFLLFALVAILIGGAIEIVPTLMVGSNIPKISSVQPYTPLELEGRDIYIREGCYNCHSQWVRPFRDEEARYGEYSKAGEFVYDHPFQWGSKRTGPDLHRSGKGNAMHKGEAWHYVHMLSPENRSEGSIMPAYVWLKEPLDISHTADKINAMRTLGVPYAEGYEDQAVADLKAQAQVIYEAIIEQDPDIMTARPDMELIALIAYLERLGSDINKQNPVEELLEENLTIEIETADTSSVEMGDTTNISE